MALIRLIGVFVLCSAAAHAASRGVNLMPPAKVSLYQALLPSVNDAGVDAVLHSSETMWYDAESIVPGYQDSMGDPKGFRPNTIESQLIDLAVPGGWRTLFADRGHFNFPFHSGGADLSDNMVKINFWSAPKQNGQVLPVVYWKLNFSRWRWMFPVGTRLGEVLLVKFPDGEMRIFEIRVRTRELDGWRNHVYRPFPSAEDLVDGIKLRRPNWFMIPALKNMIQFLLNNQTPTPRSLKTASFPGTFTTADGQLDFLPDFGDTALVKELLKETTFTNVGSTPWKTNGANKVFAASAKDGASIVPRNYDGGMLSVDDVSCRRCHKDAGRQIGEFHFNLILYGELWGEDEIFSWHPFENSAFVQADGGVANFNNDNRRLRQDFVSAGLVKAYDPANHGGSVYKELPRDWKYNPVREKYNDTPDRLTCRPNGSKYDLARVPDGKVLDSHDTFDACDETRLAAAGGVVCVWFTPSMPVGPGGWNEVGWRPTNLETGMGLGRRPHLTRQDCLDATRAAGGGVVCTNTGLGAKAANIRTNNWCGASSQLNYCLEATRHAKDETVCSFPSSGTGAEAGWVKTKVTDTCDYQSSQTSLSSCNSSVGGP